MRRTVKEPSHTLSLRRSTMPIGFDNMKSSSSQSSRFIQELRQLFKRPSSLHSYSWSRNQEAYPAYSAQETKIVDERLTDKEIKAKSILHTMQENANIHKGSNFGRFLMRSARSNRKLDSFKRMMVCAYGPVGCFRK